ncbi:hypothetical protein HDU67_003586 [Dinochytrium kinnereticum]|nr:hypothetical protein HDU67_003586 [Dinochytrium kinnereticum]
MTLHFIQLTLRSKNYKDKVSTEGCSDVAEFKGAIENKFSPLLDPYATAQLTLFQPDGITQIDPETPDSALKEIPWKPMVVTVEEPPTKGSSKKKQSFKGMSTEAFLQKKPTMGDVLAAKDGQFGKPGVAWWDYKKEDGIQLILTPLPALLSVQQWDILKSLDH